MSKTPAIVTVVALSALAIVGATRERAPRNFISPQAAADKEATMQVERDFGDDGASLVLLIDHLGRGDLFDREAARALREILATVRAIPEISRAFAFDQVPVQLLGLFKTELLPDPDSGESRLAAARERALAHPVVGGHMLSKDARTTIVPVTLTVPDNIGAREAIRRVEEGAKSAAEGSPLRVRLIGELPVAITRSDAVDAEQRRFQIIGNSLAAVLALLLFRGIGATLVVVIPTAVGVLWTLGMLGFTGLQLGGLSQVVMPVLLTMIGFTNAAHIALGVRRECESGLSRRDAITAALRKLCKPCALSAITTAVGFASLIIAEAHLIKDFGRDCALGTILTFISVILGVPLLAASPLGAGLAKTPGGSRDRGEPGGIAQFFSGVIDGVLERSRAVVGIALLLTAAFIWQASGMRPDIFVRSQLPDNSDVETGLAHADKALAGIQIVRIAATWDEGVRDDPFEVLAGVEALIEKEPLLAPPLSVNTLIEAAPAAARLFTPPARLLEDVPPEIVARFYRPDLRRALINSRVQDLGVATYAPVYERLQSRLAALETQHPGFRFRLTGGGVDWHRYLHQMVTDLALSLSIAAGIILMVITAGYRSLRIGLVAVLPNLFPLLACAAGLAALGKPLSLEIVCAFTICLGIAADDSIHFLSRFRAERADGAPVDRALHTAFLRVGHVLCVTTIVMVAGIGSILLSSLPIYRNFAGIACATLAAALVADLIILPALLKLFARRRPGEERTLT